MASLRKRGKVWYFKYTDGDGRPVERKGCTDKWVTEDMVRAAESVAAKVRAGIVDPFAAHRNRPISEHIDDHLKFLASEGDTPKHVVTTGTPLRAVVVEIGASRLSDLDAARVAEWLARQRREGLAAQTSNHYLSRIKSFGRWLVKHQRMPRNPLDELAPANVKADPRHDRGVLTREEFDALIRSTRPSETVLDLTGEDRVILNLVASYTGLRARELSSLSPASFALDCDQPTVRVPAGYTKNRTEANLPLRPDLVAILRPYLSGRARPAPVWPGSWWVRTAFILRRDRVDSRKVAVALGSR